MLPRVACEEKMVTMVVVVGQPHVAAHLASAKMVVVFPTPGGPEIMMLGTFPSLANTASLWTVSGLPTISPNVLGRYFSIQGTFFFPIFSTLCHKMLFDKF